MDKRRRVLVVEDDGHFREALVAVLTDEGCRVHAYGSSEEARAALEEVAFDLALIDIMLNGPADMSNRGGLKVLSYLKDAEEGTKVLVLSGQLHDLELVRNILKDYGADDYILKQNINKGGLDYLLKVLRPALKAKPSPERGHSWNALIRVLTKGGDEVSFVHEALQSLTFKGGLSVLQERLLEASKWLVPLLPSTEENTPAAAKIAGGLTGVYWSKGQGCAVEIIVHGTNAEGAALDRCLATGDHPELHRRTKSGLSVVVLARPDLPRSHFAGWGTLTSKLGGTL